MGCGCGLCLRISLRGPGLESRVDGFGLWLGFDLCWGFGPVRLGSGWIWCGVSLLLVLAG